MTDPMPASFQDWAIEGQQKFAFSTRQEKIFVIALRSLLSSHRTLVSATLFFVALACPTLAQESATSTSTSNSDRPAAENASELMSAADILPAETQGFLRIVSFPRVLDRWSQTEFGKLLEVPGLRDFWDEQQAEIENRLADAGWKLNIHPEDLYEISTGQIAVGWIAVPADRLKPYAVGVVADILGREESAQTLLKRVRSELMGSKATEQILQIGNVRATRFELPRKPGVVTKEESYYAISKGQLFASDNQKMLESMLLAQQNPTVSQPLSKAEDYVKAFERLDTEIDSVDVEYFARPIGLAKVLRSISRKPNNRQVDVLQVLENQGFGNLSAICGQAQLARGEFDVRHSAFIVADKPLPRSVQVLDFPNIADTDIPSWIESNAATIASISWNAKDAFWKVNGLVDELAGAEDTFRTVIEGIRDDPAGPQIDIENEVMPLVTPQIYTLSDCVEPITPDSSRSLIAIRLTDGPKMAEIVDRALRNDPDAEEFNFEGKRIWKVSREEDTTLGSDIDEDMGVFGAGEDFGSDFGDDEDQFDEDAADEQPWLSNWAITVHDDYLLFASNADVIVQTLQSNRAISELTENAAYRSAHEKIGSLLSDRPNAMWKVSLNDRAFQMQYELFRQGKLPQSRSMVASILDRLIRPKKELEDTQQKVSGNKLPPFASIEKFLLPSGSVVETKDNGWLIQSFVLAAQPHAEQTSATGEQNAIRLGSDAPEVELATRPNK
jgi:hypothetical protein